MRVVGPAVVVMIAVAFAATGAPRPKYKAERTPTDPPAGEWSVEKIEEDGEVLKSKKPGLEGWSARFTSDKWIVSIRRATITDTQVACFQNGNVSEIDLSPKNPKATRKGIWKIDGDVLMMCYGEMGGDRPTDFTAPKDSGRTLWTLKRK
jgi:uncharacterized protein (TIGR03067 family)